MQIVPVLQAAIKSRNIDVLEKALKQAESVGFPMFLMIQAARMKHVFLEEKRLDTLFKGSFERRRPPLTTHLLTRVLLVCPVQF